MLNLEIVIVELSFFLTKETHHMEKKHNHSDNNWGKTIINALRMQDKMDFRLYHSGIPADPVGITWCICVDMNIPVNKGYQLRPGFVM